MLPFSSEAGQNALFFAERLLDAVFFIFRIADVAACFKTALLYYICPYRY